MLKSRHFLLPSNLATLLYQWDSNLSKVCTKNLTPPPNQYCWKEVPQTPRHRHRQTAQESKDEESSQSDVPMLGPLLQSPKYRAMRQMHSSGTAAAASGASTLPSTISVATTVTAELATIPCVPIRQSPTAFLGWQFKRDDNIESEVHASFVKRHPLAKKPSPPPSSQGKSSAS